MSAMTPTTPLHALLGLTPDEVDDGLRRRGIDPAEQVAALRRMGRVLSAQFAPQARREQRQIDGASKMFAVYEGAVAAGSPEWAVTGESHGTASIMEVIAKSDPATTIWIRVIGWSMRDAGINDGDMVLVDTKREPRDGDTIVAHIAGEGHVVKRIRALPDGAVALESANPDFPARVIEHPSDLRIHGVVIGRAGRI